MAFPDIAIGSSFDGKGFKQALTATQKLEKNVKTLAKSFGLAFGTASVVKFGKASVKAFAEDQKAAAALTQSLKNLGLSFANTGIEDFIQKMSLSSGVSDNELRPAMQKLLQTTLNVTESQKSMALALDISAAGFGNAESVATDLAQAMVGNVKGLKKYNIGISQAELSTMSYAQIQEKLTKLFKGQAAAAADTYAGKINIIKNAAGEAQEAIGKGLIDALMAIGDDTNMQGLVDDILAVGQGIGYAISGAADLVKVLGQIPGLGFGGVGKNAPMPFTLNPLAILAQKGFQDQLAREQKLAEKRLKAALSKGWIKGAAVNPTKDTILTREEAAAGMTPAKKRKMLADEKAAAAAAAKRAKELAALQKTIAKNTKDAAKATADKNKLAKAEAMFNLDQIQIEAALKGKISEDEKLRLELQRAILNNDAELADQLQKKLEASQRATAALQGQINVIKPLTDPFAEWLKTLEDIASNLSKILGTPVNMTSSSIMNPNPNAAVGGPGAGTQTPNSIVPSEPVPVIVVPDPTPPPATNNSFASLGGSTGGFGFSLPSYLQNIIPQAPITVNVTNNGSVIMQDEFVAAVSDAVIVANTNGTNNNRPGAVLPSGG